MNIMYVGEGVDEYHVCRVRVCTLAVLKRVHGKEGRREGGIVFSFCNIE